MKSFLSLTQNYTCCSAPAEPNPSRFYDQVPESQPASSDASRFYDQVPGENSESAPPTVEVQPDSQVSHCTASLSSNRNKKIQ